MENDLCFETTEEHLPGIIRLVYDLCEDRIVNPERLIAGPIPEVMVDALLNQHRPWRNGGCVLSMNIVLGRECKFTVFSDKNGRMWFKKKWSGHEAGDAMLIASLYGKFNNVRIEKEWRAE